MHGINSNHILPGLRILRGYLTARNTEDSAENFEANIGDEVSLFWEVSC
jgi:hypothetical protein